MPETGMDPMTLAMLSGQPDALETMRKYALAQQLQGMALGGPQQPQQLGLEGKYPHAARIGPISAVAPLIEALMARQGFKTAGPAMSKMMGMGPPEEPQSTPPASPVAALPAPTQAPTAGQPSGPNPYAPVTQGDIAGTQVPNMPARLASPMFSMLTHRDPIAAAKAYREEQMGVQKQQHAGTIAQLDNLIMSDHPGQYAQSDPNFQTMWPNLARQMGVDPTTGYTDQNVRRALGLIRNPLAASVGIPEKEIPEQPIPVEGAYGYRGAKSAVTGEEKQIQPAELPTFTGEEILNPGTGNIEKKFHQTGGWFSGMSRGIAPTGESPAVSSQGGAAPGPGTVNLGMGVPKPGEYESAGYAQYMRGGMQGIQALESKGIGLSPQMRAVIIDVATAEGGGITSQVLRQELLKHGLNIEGPQAQSYLASLMPMLQAAGHAMAGARLTAGQMRTNFESLIPLDVKNKEAMAQINTNRQNFYSSLLGQSGGAIRSPLYNGTLGSDFDHLRSGHKQVNGQWYEKRADGKVYPAQ